MMSYEAPTAARSAAMRSTSSTGDGLPTLTLTPGHPAACAAGLANLDRWVVLASVPPFPFGLRKCSADELDILEQAKRESETLAAETPKSLTESVERRTRLDATRRGSRSAEDIPIAGGLGVLLDEVDDLDGGGHGGKTLDRWTGEEDGMVPVTLPGP